MTPYYSDDLVTLYHGDALETMDALGPELVDIAVTSPPYNMGLSPGGNGRGMYTHLTSKGSRFSTDGYDGASDAMPYDEYVAWQRDALSLMFRSASKAVFYNHRPRVEHGVLRVPLDFDYGLDQFEDRIKLRQIIVWDRGTGIDVNLNHFCTRGEWILLFAWDGFRLVDHAASGMGDVWRMPIVTGSEHPAPFPLALPARCIAASGARGVLDPFCGSGTTLRAAKDAGIRGVGIERSERFCEMAASRLAQGALDFGAAS